MQDDLRFERAVFQMLDHLQHTGEGYSSIPPSLLYFSLVQDEAYGTDSRKPMETVLRRAVKRGHLENLNCNPYAEDSYNLTKEGMAYLEQLRPGRVEAMAAPSDGKKEVVSNGKGTTFSIGCHWPDIKIEVELDGEAIRISGDGKDFNSTFTALGFQPAMIQDLKALAIGGGDRAAAYANLIDGARRGAASALDDPEGDLEESAMESVRGRQVDKDGAKMRQSRLTKRLKALFPHIKDNPISQWKARFKIQEFDTMAEDNEAELARLVAESQADRRRNGL